jgi:ribosomal protein L11 methyltransferase
MTNTPPAATWLVTFKIQYKYLDFFITHLENIYSDLSYFEYKTGEQIENQPDDIWIIQLYFSELPDFDKIKKQILDLAKNNDISKPLRIQLTNLNDRDWIAEIKKKSKPIIIDDFCIYNSHHKIKSNNLIPIIIDPTRAFGTGEHYTTKNCIKALCYLKNNNFIPKKLLDIGCGSGILAIAMAKLWQKPIIATDIEEQSTLTAQENININKVENLISVSLANGYQNENIITHSPYDLITCNILAQPLINMAQDLVNHLAIGGKAILSGFLTNQEKEVIAAHTSLKLQIIHKIVDNNWSTIILEKI